VTARIRVLVADDSPTARQLLAALVSADPRLELAGMARNGGEAVAMAKQLHPDVAVLDIHMPDIDGVEATRRIMSESPLPVVIVSASVDVRELSIAFEAERAGAVAAHPKPVGPECEAFQRDADQLLRTIKLMAGLKVVRRTVPHIAPAPRGVDLDRVQVVAIVCSTGGPPALARIVAKLGREFPVPVLCVQHISQGWANGLVRWLAGISKLAVKLAEDGERLRAGTLYIAPDDRHLVVSGRDFVGVRGDPPVGGFRPSGTPLLESVARGFGRDALGIMLTGMGDDGVAGMRALHAAGGFCVAQDNESSVVWGMPGAVVAAGAANEVRSLDAIVDLLERLARRRPGGKR
jgi:two-component system chemotaxis response regulator CheB